MTHALPSGQPSILYAKALELAGHDHVTAARLLKLIVDTNQSTLALLRDSFARTSWDVLGSAAHRLAGSARMLECHELLALLEQLEAVARKQELALVTALLPCVVDALESLDASIQKALDPDLARCR